MVIKHPIVIFNICDSHYVHQTELPMASLYLDHGIWSILWHRVAQMLQVQNPETDMPLHDIETEGFEVAMTSARSIMPDWTLLSFSGLVAMLHMAIVVFTKVHLFNLVKIFFLIQLFKFIYSSLWPYHLVFPDVCVCGQETFQVLTCLCLLSVHVPGSDVSVVTRLSR